MSETWVPQFIPGLYQVGKPPFTDSRGSFHKILCDAPQGFEELVFDEIYWSTSGTGVARGMHFQVPPFHGRKLVFATAGFVRDMVVDLRVGSPTFSQMWQTDLAPTTAGVLIPSGCAHGFIVIEGPATLVYAQEGTYNFEADTGINVNSIHFNDSIPKYESLSQRDLDLPYLSDFSSPFVFEEFKYPDWNKEL